MNDRRKSGADSPSQSEGDVNFSPRRAAWAARNIDAATRDILDADARLFLHQSVSTPCLSAIRKAEGIWIEDTAGRRYMDFHGNNAHHIGYGHPRLIAAIKAQLDDLSFAPRRFTNAPAVALAENTTVYSLRFAPKKSSTSWRASSTIRVATAEAGFAECGLPRTWCSRNSR